MKSIRNLALIAALTVAGSLFVACGEDNDDGGEATPTEEASPSDGNGGEDVEIELAAENVQFDKDTLEAPAGAEVSLTLDNRDTVPHSFSLFETEESEDPLFDGQEFSGPSFLTYQFAAPTSPGTYHFHCDIHPDRMKGDFVVE